MTLEVCVDANLAVMWYVPEPGRERAVSLLHECGRIGARLIAPDSIFSEAGSTIRNKVHRRLLEPDEAEVAFSLLSGARIDCVSLLELLPDAWRIATAYNLPTLYDAFYLALAELRGCDFWTADQRLLNSTPGLTYARNISDFSPGMLENQ